MEPGASPVAYLSLSFLFCNMEVIHLLRVHGKHPAQARCLMGSQYGMTSASPQEAGQEGRKEEVEMEEVG